jgi:hypothetical protein
MKEKQLREHSKCSICEQLIGRTGLPVFATVEIKNWGVKLEAIKRQDGLANLIGSSRIAQVMGGDEDMAELVAPPVTLTLCFRCSTQEEIVIAEAAMDAQQAPESGGGDA